MSWRVKEIQLDSVKNQTVNPMMDPNEVAAHPARWWIGHCDIYFGSTVSFLALSFSNNLIESHRNDNATMPLDANTMPLDLIIALETKSSRISPLTYVTKYDRT